MGYGNEIQSSGQGVKPNYGANLNLTQRYLTAFGGEVSMRDRVTGGT